MRRALRASLRRVVECSGANNYFASRAAVFDARAASRARGTGRSRASSDDGRFGFSASTTMTSRATTKRHGNAHVQVLGLCADCADSTAASVLVFTDASRYVFNVGEGFQRFCVERRLRLASRASAVFLTRVDSSSAGGLVGMLLTMSDAAMSAGIGGAGEEKRVVEVAGPGARVRALARAARTLFGAGRAVTLEERGFDVEDGDVIMDDGAVAVKPVVLGRGARASDGTESEAKRAKTTINAVEVASYDVKLAGIPGKFDMAAAVKLGVPAGPQRGMLVRGETVTLQDGTVVTPDMCVGPEQPGPRVIIFDAPTLEHVREATERGETLFRDLSDLSVVVHIAGAEVAYSSEYAELVRAVFGTAPETCAHVFANSRAMDEVPVFASSARIQARLHAVHPEVFPDGNVPTSPPPSPSRASSERRDKVPPGIANALAGKNMFKFTLIPTKIAGPDSSAVPNYVPGSFHRRNIEKKTIELAAAAMKRSPPPSPSSASRPGVDLPVPECLEKLKPGDVELVFLGTGSAMPAKYRNVSGFFMQFGGEGFGGNLMLDTGEGSLAQLIRRYGITSVNDKLRDMRLAWISHIHADHHVGLPHILAARAELFRRDGLQPPIIPVVGPRSLRRFLEFYGHLETLYCDFIDLSETTRDKWSSETMSPQIASLRAALVGTDLEEIVAVQVNHCAHAYGAKLVGKRGWSMVYSGDTRPCQSLVDASRDATLLVHEATFENGMEDEAEKKRHSTTREAVQTGIDARVYRTILTHFSQRYPKIPVFDASYTERTFVAFDLMSVDFSTLPKLPKLLPAVRSLFEDDEELARDAELEDED